MKFALKVLMCVTATDLYFVELDFQKKAYSSDDIIFDDHRDPALELLV